MRFIIHINPIPNKLSATTIPFHQAFMNNDVFKSAQFNTKFLEENEVLGVAEKVK
ncbi:hypothetical protein P4645_17450 [Lysinibacillus fusiformis]|uniref:hypothetical protein n=1 Tax=Lysinibacillus fusiformis TaxID=28031 RepID=UPI0000F36C67|nr:hypothetical protein [Lysinibacillus fusiformis]EAZ84279.1 hypothetical protein BB14905_10315 [Bacillus sp. B14905]MED4077997.1 hypothetical protein [Lysinibacillus fusiformis]